MANRVVREGFLDSEAVNALDDWEERVYHRLLVAADDAGRLDARPEILRSRLFPLGTDRRANDVLRALQRFEDLGLGYRYEVAGKPFFQLARVQKSTPSLTSKFPSWRGAYEIQTRELVTRDGRKGFILESLPEGMPKPSGSHPGALPKGSGPSRPTCAGSGTGSGTGSGSTSRPAGASWSSEACDDWTEAFGGTAPGGKIGQALKPLVAKHGWEVVRPVWRQYLADKDPEYATPQDFASKFEVWRKGRQKGPPAKRNGMLDAIERLEKQDLKTVNVEVIEHGS